jgi:CheY-like chemotaxis protein
MDDPAAHLRERAEFAKDISRCQRYFMSGTLRIVIADGSAHTRTTLEQWLTQLGHHVVAVGDIKRLAELFQHLTPDVVICDGEMTDPEGQPVAATIRRRMGVAVVILSTDWNPDRVARSLSVGAVRCLMKPVRPLELIAALSDLPIAHERHLARSGSA